MPLVFSYGTLQQEGVQMSTFGRLLEGRADALVGYAQSIVEVGNADVVARSGKTHHPIVVFTGNSEDRVSGSVFEISDTELESADAYEVDAYKRVLAPLASGVTLSIGSKRRPSTRNSRRSWPMDLMRKIPSVSLHQRGRVSV